MKFAAQCAAFRLEKSTDKERMIRELKRPYLMSVIVSHEFKIRIGKNRFERRSEAVVAIELLEGLVATEYTRKRTPRCCHHPCLRSHERTRELRDQWFFRRQIHLLMVRPAAKHISGEFHQRVLKTAARAEKGDAVFPGEAYRPYCAFSIFVGTSRRAPHATSRTEDIRERFNRKLGCAHPSDF